jgi:murein DD-endopeptidase MepM/ murein hydrolase activator NlpD
MRRFLIVLIALLLAASPGSASAAAWLWPVVGPVLRGFDPPDSPYGAGHRGIDIAVAVGAVVVAPDDGVVSFAGQVGGRLFVTVDHGQGWLSTVSFLSATLVREGEAVVAGQPVAISGWGHVDAAVPHVHLGVRQDGDYVDPMDLLAPLSVSGFIRLAPL